ncbi:DUF4862 family protein [Sanguibacter antarcticus]|nr:DUF4862 family protein [Sanguibacter antarcticus]
MPSPTVTPRTTLGAYALGPSPDLDDGRADAAFYDGLAELTTTDGHGIDALELPLDPEGSPRLELGWLTRHLHPSWDLMVTAVPRTMKRLSTQPAYGLASADEDARRAAVADIAVVRDLARALADASGRVRVTAIELQSAPGSTLGSRDALARSIDEILAWDVPGAELVIEHCDAPVDGQQPVKGFLTLADELAVIRDLPDTVGIGINWGRSAIEGRSAATPIEHTAAAVAAGRLRSLIFSGASDVTTPWGRPWSDAHIPAYVPGTVLDMATGSLLTADATTATLAAAAGQARYVGAKVTVRPTDTDVPTRLAVARASLDLVASSAAVLR